MLYMLPARVTPFQGLALIVAMLKFRHVPISECDFFHLWLWAEVKSRDTTRKTSYKRGLFVCLQAPASVSIPELTQRLEK